jgi:hypothetical protein
MNVFYRPSRKGPDERFEREWYVDGARVADLGAAIAALDKPAAFAPEEREILERIPRDPVPLEQLEVALAGGPHPQGGVIARTAHERVLHLMYALRSKGAIAYGRTNAPDGSEGQISTVKRVV